MLLHLLIALESTGTFLPLRKPLNDHGVGDCEALGVQSVLVCALHLSEDLQGIIQMLVCHEHVNHLPVELLAWHEALLAGNVVPELPGHVELPALTIRLYERGVGVHRALPGRCPAGLAEGVECGVDTAGVTEADASLQGHVHEDVVHLDHVLLDQLDRPVKACSVHHVPSPLVALKQDADGVGINAGALRLHDVHGSPRPGKVAGCQCAAEQRVVGGRVRPEAALAHLLEQSVHLRQRSGLAHVLLQQYVVRDDVHVPRALHLSKDPLGRGLVIA
mmetsp:Transcript_54829/g.127639  ORF Transcript_54829/g.127639 Transcript_54829/m.127639 type:complete len:276 (-) Transcript_54829:1-828(-)